MNNVIKFHACDSCVIVLVNADDSHIDQETSDLVAATDAAIRTDHGMTTYSHAETIGYFDCDYCSETSIGEVHVFETVS